MKSIKTLFVFASAIAVLLLCVTIRTEAQVSSGDPISGDWDGTAQFPDVPPVQIKLKLKLSGKTVAGEVDTLTVTDGIWADNKLTLNSPKSVMTATIKGGKLVGEMVNLAGTRGTWEARRKGGVPGAASKTLPTTLPELLTLIQNELDTATATKGDGDVRSIRKIVQPTFSGCSLTYADTTFIESPFGGGSAGADVTLSLTDLDPDAVTVQPAEEGYKGVQLQLKTINNESKIKRVGKPMVMGNQVVGSGREIQVNNASIAFGDSETADRVGKAFSQAIKLCKKPN